MSAPHFTSYNIHCNIATFCFQQHPLSDAVLLRGTTTNNQKEGRGCCPTLSPVVDCSFLFDAITHMELPPLWATSSSCYQPVPPSLLAPRVFALVTTVHCPLNVNACLCDLPLCCSKPSPEAPPEVLSHGASPSKGKGERVARLSCLLF